MDLQNNRMLKTAAADALQAAPNDPKKLILLHSAAMLLLSLLLTVVDYLLEHAIADTGGLGGLGTRSVLSTVQSCLQLSQLILLPFWQIGYTYVTIKFARKEAAQPMDLCKGFFLFLPMLRLLLLQGLLYIGIGIAASNLGMILFSLTPWSAPFMSAAMDMMYGGGSAEDMSYAMEKMQETGAVPLVICSILVFIAIAVPFFYRFRMAQYLLLDGKETGALAAMRTSGKLMRGNGIALFKLDLSFWWFYALDLLVTTICYADMLLAMLGITLPVDATFAFFATFVAYLAAQLALYWWRKNEVSTTYAYFYHVLSQPKEETPAPVAQNQPWYY